ncbi:MAG TPA: LLM class flavin-dependent oxidoreductase [Methylomirabilota bacterium]|nr:LLM class flavin-dependent oxidoreductase [Methylomirabilota bacterium]
MAFGLGLWPDHPAPRAARLAALAEAHGFEGIWVPDERFHRDCYLTLGAIAQATARARLGPFVTDPYSRHPALTAVALATLDELAGGRAVLGLGAGISGFGALGIARDDPATAMREAVGLVRRLWAGETVSQAGRVVQFHGGRLDFAARSTIPVLIAGRGPRILELAGALADGVIIGALFSPPTLAYALDHVRAGAAGAGRGLEAFERILWCHAALHPDPRQARAAVRPIVLGILVSSRAVLGDLGVRLPPALARAIAGARYAGPGAAADLAAQVPDDVLAHFAMAGDGAQCRAEVARLAGQGITHLAVVPWLVPGQTLEAFITTFAREVLAG